MARVWFGFMTARILIATVLLVLQISIAWLSQPVMPWIFGMCSAYLATTILVRIVARPMGLGQAFDPQWIPTIGADLAVYSVLQFAQLGGISYTPLYALPVLLAAVLGSVPLALGTAAGVTLLLLADAWWMGAAGGDLAARYLQAGLTGIGFFMVAFLASQLAARLVREEKEALRSQLAARTQIQVSELVIEALGDGILVVDANGVVRVINPAARRMLGPAGLQRSAPFVLAAELAWQPLVDLSRQTFDSRASQAADLVLVHDGLNPQPVQVRTRLTGLTDSSLRGDFESLCVVFLQDLRETEARIRTEKLAAMGRMSAAVAHEIRNPLAAITQANALLMEDLSAAPQRQLSQMVGQNAQRLARIVDEVLDLARVQQSSWASESSSTMKIDPVVQAACEEWATQTGSQGLLQIRLCAADASIVFEQEHLRRILVNLLDNARRYVQQAPHTLQVETAVRDPRTVRLSVWSAGAPLEASVRAHLFEPFFSSESRSSGLGLYICRELCERYGASISYQRAEQAGQSGNAFFVDCHLAVQSATTALADVPGFATIAV